MIALSFRACMEIKLAFQGERKQASPMDQKLNETNSLSTSPLKTELKDPQHENPWLNLVFNIAIPVLILNKAGSYIGAGFALALAIFFPLAFGLLDLRKSHKINWISVLGLFNVIFTGGLALLGKTGLWFAFKEAAFPLLIGAFVWFSAFTQKPALSFFILRPQVFNLEKMNHQLNTDEKKQSFNLLMKRATQLLSFSFLVSAALNFGLAAFIFKPIDPSLQAEAQSQVLNEQIAQMTQWSFVVILVPSLIILVGIMLYFSRQFKKITGSPLEDYLQQSPENTSL